MAAFVRLEIHVAYTDGELTTLIELCRSVYADNQFTIVVADQAVCGKLRELDKFVNLQLDAGVYSDAEVDFCQSIKNCWLQADRNSLNAAAVEYARVRGVLINADNVNDPDKAVEMTEIGVRQITGSYLNLP